MSRHLTIALWMALALPAALLAQDPFRLKPGAKGTRCLDCHFAMQETMDLAFVHTPVKSGACSDCHDPHASDHGAMLASEIGEICVGCHSEIVPAAAVSGHRAALEGSCATCHDPHASANANNLVRPGNELCIGCHEEVGAAATESEFGHAPVRDCLACHDPHASTSSEFLLKKEMGALCAECHRTGQASFRERHMGYPVADSRCTSCHEAHGSDRSGLLLAEVHEPVANKMCSQCHLEASSSSALETKKAGLELCRGCHSRMLNQALARGRLHWPVGDQKGCVNCHNPHASKEKGLLSASPKALCGSCHSDVMRSVEGSAAGHSPVADGECSSCHAPHASDDPFLLQSSNHTELCGECHDWQTHSTHPIGEGVIDQRNMNLTVDCLSCHRAHGSPFKALAHFDPDGELCLECHMEVRR